MITNREYLDSLSNEEFAKWIFNILEVEDRTGRYPLKRIDGLNYVTISYIDPYIGFLRWLNEEHKNYS